MSLLLELADMLNMQVINSEQHIWFFRTKAGRFYHDFKLNNYIALGWDLISPELICDTQKGKESKIELIANLYENEKRPGLIYGQMDTFYNRMTGGDLVVIPSSGGKKIQVGILGECLNEVVHKETGDEYPQCSYKHKRHVEWIKEIESYQDIYLFKALRAQQTISDITDEGKLVFRNLFSTYISENKIHLTLSKRTSSELGLANNVDLFINLLNLVDETASLYGMESFRGEITFKTAVGSPGLIEVILPGTPIALIVVGILKYAIGKSKSSDGSTETGILALIEKINSMVNDYHNRKKVDAETRKLAAETKLTEAQARKTEAEAREIELKNKKYEQIEILQSGLTTVQTEEQQEKLTIQSSDVISTESDKITQSTEGVCNAAAASGLYFDGKKIEKVG